MERKLASIQRIVSIEPIPEADAIEKCTVLGWEVVIAKKDNFKVGDLVCYIETDSTVPDKPEFEFLKQRKFRVRTIKLKKQVSQGLVLPLSVLPKKNYHEGDDVTKIVGVKKYDPQGDAERKIADELASRTNNKIKKFMMKNSFLRRFIIKKKKDGFPRFIKKTDEDRIQLFPDICEREKDTKFIVTEKLDGQSGTYFLLRQAKFKFLKWEFGKQFIFGVCSRNLHLPKENDSSYWSVARKFEIKKILENLISDNRLIVLQGEILGNAIQGNKYRISGYDFYAFNLKTDKKNYDAVEMNEVLKEYRIKTVPILYTNFNLKSSIPEMVEFAKGKSLLEDIFREGIVCRNYEKNISFKVISTEFLLQYEE